MFQFFFPPRRLATISAMDKPTEEHVLTAVSAPSSMPPPEAAGVVPSDVPCASVAENHLPPGVTCVTPDIGTSESTANETLNPGALEVTCMNSVHVDPKTNTPSLVTRVEPEPDTSSTATHADPELDASSTTAQAIGQFSASTRTAGESNASTTTTQSSISPTPVSNPAISPVPVVNPSNVPNPTAPIDLSSHAGRNPSMPVIPPTHSYKKAKVDKLTKATKQKARAEEHKALTEAIADFMMRRDNKIEELAVSHHRTKKYIEDLVNSETHYKKTRELSIHNAKIHWKSMELNASEPPFIFISTIEIE